jgi:hypothetical protein
LTQEDPDGHALPQAPQLAASVCVSTQAAVLAQNVGAALGHAQVPPTQLSALGQTFPPADAHPPQLAALVCVSTQVPAQDVGAVAGHPHAPPTQLVPPVQTLPPWFAQPPQLAPSVCVSTHRPPHSVVELPQAHWPFWQTKAAPCCAAHC